MTVISYLENNFESSTEIAQPTVAVYKLYLAI